MIHGIWIYLWEEWVLVDSCVICDGLRSYIAHLQPTSNPHGKSTMMRIFQCILFYSAKSSNANSTPRSYSVMGSWYQLSIMLTHPHSRHWGRIRDSYKRLSYHRASDLLHWIEMLAWWILTPFGRYTSKLSLPKRSSASMPAVFYGLLHYPSWSAYRSDFPPLQYRCNASESQWVLTLGQRLDACVWL